MVQYSVVIAKIIIFDINLSVPTVSPMMVNANRSDNGTVLFVDWQPVSLENAGGFYRNLIVLSSNQTNEQDLTIYVPFSESNTVITGLNPSSTYTLTMRIIVIDTVGGEEINGPNSDPLTVKSIASGNHQEDWIIIIIE